MKINLMLNMWKFIHINKALKKLLPKSIPMSEPRCLDNDFFEIEIFIPNLNWKFLCKSKEKGGYSGFLWIDNYHGYGSDTIILLKTLDDYKFSTKIIHHYKCYQFEYNSKVLFLLSVFLKKHRFVILKNKLVQHIYNKKTLIRSERMEFLNYLVEETIDNPDYSTDPIFIGMNMHSNRWYYHPKREEHQSHYKLLLDSLVESKDLKLQDLRYSITGKALATLSEYERDQQKHQDNLNIAKIANNLTRVLIIIGGFTILTQLFIWWKGS